MGVWATPMIYQPNEGRRLCDLMPALRLLAEAISVDVFSSGSIGVGDYDGFEDEVEILADIADCSPKIIEDAFPEFPQATFLRAGWIVGEPKLVDDVNKHMHDHPEVTGDYNVITFGINLGSIRIRDEDGDELFRSDLMIDFGGDSSPNNGREYARLLLASPPINELFSNLEEIAAPKKWEPAFVVT